MKKVMFTIAVLMLSVMTFAQTPAPVVVPDGVQWNPASVDPNAPVMGKYKLATGQSINTQCIKVFSDANTAPVVTAQYVSFSAPVKVGSDWQYNWSYAAIARGVYYDKITVTDAYGADKRTIVIQVVGKPVITACGGR
jgi:hypothetical protein